MAKEEMHKKWGTIFMGEREASVEQLNAMQEPLRRERQQKEQAEDYMERVRTRAADRARQILGEAYTERQKILEEAKAQAELEKKQALADVERMKAEVETARKLAQTELARAEAERAEAKKAHEAAHEEGIQAGMEQATQELHEFRAELGRSLASVLHAIERERVAILNYWRDDLVELVKCAVQAGTSHIINSEQAAILKALVFQALDLLEQRTSITMRVNPQEENTVSDMFRAARERYPELRQWVVNGDEQIEPGGLIAESGSGSVDLRRCNFREMVQGIIDHLGLPDQLEDNLAVRELVEKEVAHIASLTPELEEAPAAVSEPPESVEAVSEVAEDISETLDATEEIEPDQEVPEAQASLDEEVENINGEFETEEPELEMPEPMEEADNSGAEYAQEPSLEELEEELFPLDEPPAQAQDAQTQDSSESGIDSKTLTEGGFL